MSERDVSAALHQRARLLLELGRAAEALDELRRPGVDSEDEDTWYLRALASIELEEWHDARDSVQRGLAVAPDSWSLLDLLSMIHLHHGDLVAAEQAVLGALRTYAESPHLLCRYAQIVAGAGQVAKARALVERAAGIDPENSAVVRMRALLAYADGKDRDAVMHSRELLALDPSDPYGHFLHGQMLRNLGDVDAAHHHLGTAVVGNPRDSDYAEIARQSRVQSHWLMWPLRPVHRFGSVPVWITAIVILFVLEQLPQKWPILAFAIFWIVYCLYSWIVPPLLRRWLIRE